MDKAEKLLLAAAAHYSRSKNVSLAKMSWALSSIFQKPEGSIYHLLREVDEALTPDLKELRPLLRVVKDIDEQEVEEIEDDKLESRVGEVVTVTVLSIKTFGAVCSIKGTSRTLLLHLSELVDGFVTDIRDHIKEGDELQAMLVVNPKDQLGLSTRRIKTVSA